MLQPVRGVLAVENTQTGDGRVIAPGACIWLDPPLPLAWIDEGDQHVDMVMSAPQIGTIDSITRNGDDIVFDGSIDDAIPQGAECVRRMSESAATHGERFGVSIDPDDWAVELIVQDVEEGETEGGGLLILASGAGSFARLDDMRRGIERTLCAAAGDADPGEDGGDSGVVVMEDSADSLLERFTRLRIRGATLCAVPAFDGAYCELSSPPQASESAPGASESNPATPAAQTAAADVPTLPPRSWFDDPSFGPADSDARLVHDELADVWACPLTVLDDGRVFGHLAPWEQCHIGIPDGCTTAPPSMSNYAYFRTGDLVCDDATHVAVGALTLEGGHPDRALSANAAVAHYDETRSAVADVACGEDEYGIWIAGALRPGVSDEQLRVLRASALSGDWRPVAGGLELVAALCVNVQGFPIPRREAALADGRQLSLVAAGVDVMARLQRDRVFVDELLQTARSPLDRRLAAVERAVAPLRKQALDAVKQSVRAQR